MNTAVVEAWLQDHTGLVASSLGAGVVARATRDRAEALGLEKAEEYLALLATSAAERQLLIDRVIVPETWFFRDRPAIDGVVRHVTETWGPAHPGRVFRVLCLPCSTGEEPYSLAIAFALAGWPLTHLRIDALDIGSENLARARAGVYGKNSFRGDDLAFRDAFFAPAGRDTWSVNDRVRSPVQFAAANLLADDFATSRGLYDAVFCRNLLIYFDRFTQARAIRALDALLAPGAWLAVGPAEPVLFFEHGFSALKIPSSFLLAKGPPQSPARPLSVAAPSQAAAAAWQRPAWSFEKAPAKPPAPPERSEKTDTPATIRALADAGELGPAAQRGAALLARAGASAELLCVLAVVADAAGDVAKAEEFYRKTIYLDPRHTEALSHLALLAEKKGDLRAARQFRARAQRVSPGAEELA